MNNLPWIVAFCIGLILFAILPNRWKPILAFIIVTGGLYYTQRNGAGFQNVVNFLTGKWSELK